MNIIENERQNCAKSFAYFCEHYLKVLTPDGLIPLRLFSYQSRLIKELETNQFVIGKKFRQGGFTTLMTAWYLWRCMFKLDEANMIVVKMDREARWSVDVAKRFIQELPDWLQPKISKMTDHLIVFDETGSKLFLRSNVSEESCCGQKLNNLYVDEAAFHKNMDKTWKCLWPTVCDGKVCILSTPNGVGSKENPNWFYEQFILAQVEESQFKVYTCSIEEHPIFRDMKWKKKILEQMGFKGYRQEVLAEFLIPDKDVQEVILEQEEDPAWHPVSSIEEEVAKMQELDPNWRPDVQPHECKNSKRIERVFLCGDDANDPFDSWENKSNPRSHQWEKLDRETIHVIFEKDHMHWDESETKHPDIDRSKEFETVEDLSEFWEGMAQIDPELSVVADMYRKAAQDKDARYQELEDNLCEYCDPEMLALGGVLDSDEANQLRFEFGEQKTVIKSGRLDIIERILSEGEFPKNMNLGIHKEYLSINGVPTNILTDAIKWAYMGLTSLTSHEEAVDHIALILKAKIKNLF